MGRSAFYGKGNGVDALTGNRLLFGNRRIRLARRYGQGTLSPARHYPGNRVGDPLAATSCPHNMAGRPYGCIAADPLFWAH